MKTYRNLSFMVKKYEASLKSNVEILTNPTGLLYEENIDAWTYLKECGVKWLKPHLHFCNNSIVCV